MKINLAIDRTALSCLFIITLYLTNNLPTKIKFGLGFVTALIRTWGTCAYRRLLFRRESSSATEGERRTEFGC